VANSDACVACTALQTNTALQPFKLSGAKRKAPEDDIKSEGDHVPRGFRKLLALKAALQVKESSKKQQAAARGRGEAQGPHNSLHKLKKQTLAQHKEQQQPDGGSAIFGFPATASKLKDKKKEFLKAKKLKRKKGGVALETGAKEGEMHHKRMDAPAFGEQAAQPPKVCAGLCMGHICF
jgi:hypothetical protein